MRELKGRTVSDVCYGGCSCGPDEYCQCPTKFIDIKFTDGTCARIEIRNLGYDGMGLSIDLKQEGGNE